MAAERIVLWLRNDLRLADNTIVADAAKRLTANRKLEVVPVYCFDPRYFCASEYGPKKTGVYRAKFLLESVQDLKIRLNGIGSDLLVFSGKPEEVIPTLLLKDGKTLVFTNEEVTDEELRIDRAVQRAVAQQGGELKKVWGSTLFHKDDLPFQDFERIPDVFTPFRSLPPILPTSRGHCSLRHQDERDLGRIGEGEKEAAARRRLNVPCVGQFSLFAGLEHSALPLRCAR
jgi:deoxyribodipyrimidine photo-lyase